MSRGTKKLVRLPRSTWVSSVSKRNMNECFIRNELGKFYFLEKERNQNLESKVDSYGTNVMWVSASHSVN